MTDLKLDWEIYPIAWDDDEQEYTGEAVRMTERLHFANRTFPSYAYALNEASSGADSFIISADFSSEVTEAFDERGMELWPEFSKANKIPEELSEHLLIFNREFEQTVYG